jgi:hypothetical protein
MSVLRKAWVWITAAGAMVALFFGWLWRQAVRQRNEARIERDLARRSAERERVLQDEHQQIDVATRRDIAAVPPAAEKAADDAARAAQSDPVKELNRRLAK